MLLLMCFLLPSSYGKFHGVYTCYNAKAHLPSNKRTVPTAWLMFEQRHDNKVQQLQVHTPINGVLRLNFQHWGNFHTSNKQFSEHQLGVWAFSSILTLSNQRQHWIPHIDTSVLQDCTTCHSHFRCQSQTCTSDQLAKNQRSPWPPVLRFH